MKKFLLVFVFVVVLTSIFHYDTYAQEFNKTEFGNLSNKVESLELKVNQTDRVDTLINTISFLAAAMLGSFAIIGGLLVWNGFSMRKEAKEDLAEIRLMRVTKSIKDKNKQMENLANEFEAKKSAYSAVSGSISSFIPRPSNDSAVMRALKIRLQDLEDSNKSGSKKSGP
jgi:hypothetical protein